MAKIVEDQIVINISRIAKDEDTLPGVVTQEMLQTLDAVVTELVGAGAVIEVIAAE
jgi:hypothetical protein